MLDSITNKLDFAIQVLDIGWSISKYGTRLISQSQKFISHKVSRMKGIESQAKSLQQVGIIKVKHNPRLKRETLSNSEKLKLIKLVLFQPKINFPINKEIQSQGSKH